MWRNRPDAGRVQIEGLDIASDRSQGLERTNFAAVYTPLPGNLTASQNLRVFGLLYEVKDLSKRIEELLKQFDPVVFRNKKCGVLFLFGISLGIFGSALVLRFGPASEWFIWPLPALISPFAGVLYPVATLPHWMQMVSRVLPPSYVFEGLRAIISGGTVSGTALVIGAGLAVGYIFLAYGFFTRVYQSALRTGLIARYSAENLG